MMTVEYSGIDILEFNVSDVHYDGHNLFIQPNQYFWGEIADEKAWVRIHYYVAVRNPKTGRRLIFQSYGETPRHFIYLQSSCSIDIKDFDLLRKIRGINLYFMKK